MRIDEVTADAFGPLPAGAVLTLAPGLTVVWGPNEAGKSSWHAALFAGLCGQRRGPGKRAEQRELEEAHRPWAGGAWQVSTTVSLTDGRVLELRHDLDSPERSRVTDRDTGADLTGELIFDGAPDGAGLLGLTRRTLPHTVMVRQADMLACTDGADELQHMLQRAAATAGDAATADEAVRLIERARAESVGTEQAPTRPLAQALAALRDAEGHLAKARADHADYVALRAEHDEAVAASASERMRLARLEAERERRHARALRRRLEDAEQLSQRLPAELVAEVEATRRDEADQPPAATADAGGRDAVTTDDPEAGLAEEVARVRTEWELRPPAPETPLGSTADELRTALAELPEPPDGDTEAHPEVERAAERWREALSVLQRHDRRAPPEAAPPVAAQPGELRQAADALAEPPPGVDDELGTRVRELHGEQVRRRKLRAVSAIVAAALVALAAALLVAAGPAWAALAVAGAALAALTAARVGRFEADDELADARAELAAQRRDAARDAERRQWAEQWAGELGVTAKPDQLRELAREVARVDDLEQQRAAWAGERGDLAGELAEAERELQRALRERGMEVTAYDDLAAALDAYRRACRHRAEQAQHAGRREDLAARLAAREAAERQASDQRRQRQGAAAALVAAGRRVVAESAHPAGVGAAVAAVEASGAGDAADADVDDAEAGDAGATGGRAAALAGLDEALAEWQRGHTERQRQRTAHERERARLASLLGGDTVDELRAAARQAEERAEARCAQLTDDAADLSDLAELDEDTLEACRQAAADAAEQARRREAEIGGQLARQEETMRPVAEAEETYARQAAEVERLRTLGTVLDTASSHLRRASERINRDIAPALRHTVERWLPTLTGGRYQRVAVDPTTLEVTVDTPEAGWRPAGRLSHGTSEQVYLLLRVALAEHLVTTEEPAPLLLDEPTAQSDDERTVAILRLLVELARERQVVVFTQETLVREWARAELDDRAHRLVALDAGSPTADDGRTRPPTSSAQASG